MYAWVYFSALDFVPLVHLFWCRYHSVLMATAVWYSLKSGSVTPPALFFFLRIFWLFGVFFGLGVFFLLQWKCHWNLDRDLAEAFNLDVMGWSGLAPWNNMQNFRSIQGEDPWMASPSPRDMNLKKVSYIVRDFCPQSRKRQYRKTLEPDFLGLKSPSATCQLCHLGQALSFSVLWQRGINSSSFMGWLGQSEFTHKALIILPGT